MIKKIIESYNKAFVMQFLLIIGFVAIFVIGLDAYSKKKEAETTREVTYPVIKAISITKLSPSFGSTGSRVTISGSEFTKSGNIIKFSNYPLGNFDSSGGHTLTFTVPKELQNCSKNYCTDAMIPISIGNHSISVTNSKGDSNDLNFEVTSNYYLQ